jgi:hypothetical protein
VAGWPDQPDRVASVVAGLVRDGLADLDAAGALHLAGDRAEADG